MYVYIYIHIQTHGYNWVIFHGYVKQPEGMMFVPQKGWFFKWGDGRVPHKSKKREINMVI